MEHFAAHSEITQTRWPATDARALLGLDEDRDTVLLLDAALRIEGMNGVAERMLGYRREDLVGKPVAVVLGRPGHRMGAPRSLDELLRGDQPAADVPLVLVTREGARLDVRFTRVRLGDGGGCERFVCIARPHRGDPMMAGGPVEAFELGALVDSVRRAAEARLGKGGLRLQLSRDLPDELRGDPERLRRVLLLLVAETSRGTQDQRARLRVTPESPQGEGYSTARLRFSVRGSRTDLTVAQARELDRVTAGVPQDDDGHGGLRRCRELVRLMGGEIWIDTDPGWGCELHVEIPFRTVSHHASEATLLDGMAAADAAETHTAPAPSRKILVVAYSRVSRLLLTRILERQGHEAESVATGCDALDKVLSSHFDLILVEGRLPDLQRDEFVRELRKLCGDDRPRLMGLVSPGTGVQDLDAAAVKPLHPTAIARAISEVFPL